MYCIENTISVFRKILLSTQLGKVIDKVQNAADSPTVDKVDVTILFCLWKHSNYMSRNLYKMFFNSRLNLAAGCHVFYSSFSILKSFYIWEYSITCLVAEKLNEALATKIIQAAHATAADIMSAFKEHPFLSVLKERYFPMKNDESKP